jgi:hypothetical protein
MLTGLITSNLMPSYDLKKLYTRKTANFLEKSMGLFVIDKSNDYLVRKKKHSMSY